MTAQLDPVVPSSWSPEELAAVRGTLASDVARLTTEIALVGRELAGAAAEAGRGMLHDEVDLAANRLDMLHDAAQAENASAILEQTEHVIARLDAGLYGTCESCSGEIARARLEAFPRATLCITCVA